MTLQQLLLALDTVSTTGSKIQNAGNKLCELALKARAATVRNEFQPPLTQSDVDLIVTTETPLYLPLKQAVLDLYNALP